MTIQLFLLILTVAAVVCSLITQAVKKFMDEAGWKYSSNLVVLVVAFVVGTGGTAILYIFMGVPFTVINIICMILMGLAVWVGSMVGYDKVTQLIQQIIKYLK